MTSISNDFTFHAPMPQRGVLREAMAAFLAELNLAEFLFLADFSAEINLAVARVFDRVLGQGSGEVFFPSFWPSF